ncbi:MAG: hypothetical protein IIY36_12070 [Lachnospiraceae bacterium]|nr:hypothetical protein [Lachnospiraceae bacterium]
MFFTGAFKVDERTMLAVNKVHDGTQYDDDVISWLSEDEMTVYSDGYISNHGDILTMHIKTEYMSEDNIDRVKSLFCPETELRQVRVARVRGWGAECFAAGIN